VRRDDNLTTLHDRIVLKCGITILLKPSRSVQDCFTFTAWFGRRVERLGQVTGK